DHNASHSPASHRIRVSVLPSSCASASPSLSAIGPREDAAWPGHIVVVLVSGHHHPDLHHHRCPVAHLSAGAEEETRQPPSLISGEASDEHLRLGSNSYPTISSFGLICFNNAVSPLCSPATVAVQLGGMRDAVQCWCRCTGLPYFFSPPTNIQPRQCLSSLACVAALRYGSKAADGGAARRVVDAVAGVSLMLPLTTGCLRPMTKCCFPPVVLFFCF
ncbi:uncharacterized protein, partial [Triticum aestivum]|uniref:uncharacterized protein n=1 Tax=Triticum aestivum TaxID=4565 RepID=UPI001D00D01D